MTDTLNYTQLIAWEHRNQPNYNATVALTVEGDVDCQNLLARFATLFDVDTAVGQQLDFTGQWIGRTRVIQIPLNIFFSFDIAGLGFDEGYWYSPFDIATGSFSLPDLQYRILLKATIAANYWDGTIPGAVAAWDKLLLPFGFTMLMQDYGDMTMAIAIVGGPLDTITQALFTTGELDLKPAGVLLYHIIPSVNPGGNVPGGTPYFGFDVENPSISGFDLGAWGLVISEE